MVYKCINCQWQGEETNDRFCPVCGDNVEVLAPVEEIKPKPKRNILDLDGDGDVDKDDRSLAGKVLASGRRKKKKSIFRKR